MWNLRTAGVRDVIKSNFRLSFYIIMRFWNGIPRNLLQFLLKKSDFVRYSKKLGNRRTEILQRNLRALQTHKLKNKGTNLQTNSQSDKQI